jgi:hypothetical protein
MSYSPLTLTRRHVLGDFYRRCENVVTVPVYLNGTDGEMIGYADEGLGKYADAFTFHLSEEVCKKLSAGQFTYSFGYEFTDDTEVAATTAKRPIKLTSITLTMRKGYEKPQPKIARVTEAKIAEAA